MKQSLADFLRPHPIDPHRALIRNAAAHERFLKEQANQQPSARRTRPQVKMWEIPVTHEGVTAIFKTSTPHVCGPVTPGMQRMIDALLTPDAQEAKRAA